MSLLRQRATDVRVESSFRAGRPAFTRLRLVRATSSASDEELNEPASQPNARDGLAKATTDVTAKVTATAIAIRRTDALRRATSDGARNGTVKPAKRDISSGAPRLAWGGGLCCGHGRFGIPGCPRRDGHVV